MTISEEDCKMNTMSKIILGLALAALAACAGMATPIPDRDSPEARLYESKCSICHSTPHPGRHTASQWEKVLVRMDKEMEFKKMPPLTPDEKSTILGYLQKHAR
jgi:cytochrome c5